MDSYTYEQCRVNKEIRGKKIKNLEHAIKQSEAIISESKLDDTDLIFLRKKVAQSKQDLEVLYLFNEQYG